MDSAVGTLEMPRANEAYRDTQLPTLVEELAALNPDALTRKDKLGEIYSFSAGRDNFARIKTLARELAETDWSHLTKEKAQELVKLGAEVRESLQQISSFSPDNVGGNPVGVRDNLLRNLANNYNKLFDEAAPIIGHARAVMPSDETSESSKILEEMRTALVEQQKLSDDARETAEKLRTAAQQGGVAAYAEFFEDQAKEHKKSATNWLWISGLLLAATAAWAAVNYWHAIAPLSQAQPDLTASQLVQLTVARGIVFTILLTVLVWCGRVYRAHRHNYVVNRHRRNALNTFEAFVKATQDAQTKDAVLLEATHCIFSPQMTGYVTQESELEGGAKLVEVVRSVTTGKDK